MQEPFFFFCFAFPSFPLANKWCVITDNHSFFLWKKKKREDGIWSSSPSIAPFCPPPPSSSSSSSIYTWPSNIRPLSYHHQRIARRIDGFPYNTYTRCRSWPVISRTTREAYIGKTSCACVRACVRRKKETSVSRFDESSLFSKSATKAPILFFLLFVRPCCGSVATV